MSVECVNQLGFHRPLTSLVKESLIVRNTNSRPVAFKIKTTAPKQYCVRPNSGRIEPGQEVEVQVLLQAMKEEPPQDYKCRDKFLVQSTIITAEHESSSISTLWNAIEAESKDQIHEKKIRCVFVSADRGDAPTSGGHDTIDHSESQIFQESATPAYHATEFGTNDSKPETTTKVPEAKVATPASSKQEHDDDKSALQGQLDDAQQKIAKLEKQLNSATSLGKRTESKSAVHNEGVPVPLTALIALLAFMAASKCGDGNYCPTRHYAIIMSQRYATRPSPNATTYSPQEQEQANDAMVDDLRGKVSMLRDVSIKIGEESRSSMGYMAEMNDDYSKQFETMRRMKNRLLAASNMHSWGWFHLLLFMMLIMLIFFLVYLFK